jgi:hypothetical protein
MLAAIREAGGKFYAEKPNGTEPESQNQQR